jgi:hypothetical protein
MSERSERVAARIREIDPAITTTTLMASASALCEELDTLEAQFTARLDAIEERLERLDPLPPSQALAALANPP